MPRECTCNEEPVRTLSCFVEPKPQVVNTTEMWGVETRSSTEARGERHEGTTAVPSVVIWEIAYLRVRMLAVSL